jgi:hypothetical protein
VESQLREDAVIEHSRLQEPGRAQQRKNMVENRVEPDLVEPSQKKTTSRNSNLTVASIFIWRAPAAMIGLLLLGVLIGIGHHLCYNFLNGKPVGRYPKAGFFASQTVQHSSSKWHSQSRWALPYPNFNGTLSDGEASR